MNSVVEFILPFLQSYESLNLSITSQKLSCYVNDFWYLVQKPLISKTKNGILINTGSEYVLWTNMESMNIYLHHKQPQIEIVGYVTILFTRRLTYYIPYPIDVKQTIKISFKDRWLYFNEFKQIRLRQIEFNKIFNEKSIENYNWESKKIEEQRQLMELETTRRLLMKYESYKDIRVYNEYNWPKHVWSKKPLQ